MADPGLALFDSLKRWDDLEQLVANGETEGLHLECKSPGSPNLSPGSRGQLAEAVSGFSNTVGGVVIWGMATTRHAHTHLDVLSQIEPIGHVKGFAAQVDRAIPLLAFPTVQCPPTRLIKRKTTDTKGVALTYVPSSQGDPVQSLIDHNFYWRTTDGFVELPYDMLKRMFSGTAGPDLEPVFDVRLITKEPSGAWRIPFVIQNRSSAAAADAMVTVVIENPDACTQITPESFSDASHVNPGQRMYQLQVEEKIHRGLNLVVGALVVVMAKSKLPRRVLKLKTTIYASNMRARRWTMTVHLSSSGFRLQRSTAAFVY